MAESPDLIGERIERAEGHDFRHIFVVSDESYRNSISGVFNEMRVWSVAEDSRAQYNEATVSWEAVTETWDARNTRYLWFLDDFQDSAAAIEFLRTTKGLLGVSVRSGEALT